MITKNKSQHVVSLFVLFLFIILAVGSVDTDSDTKEVQSKAVSYTLSADQLYGAYNDNEVAADTKYKGKVVIVYGMITDIGKDIMDDAYVIIDGGFLNGVQCMFTQGEQSSVARLSKGQNVKIRGEVTGKMGNVLVSKCRLQ